MKRKQEHLGIGTRIAAGFLVILMLMASLTAVGLRHISETNKRLKDIVENNNVKTELAVSMQATLRERALSMHALSVLTDPFDKDDEVQRFDSAGSAYVLARQRLEQLPSLNREERAILNRIRILTREAQPEVQAVVDLALSGEGTEVFERIRNIAMPRQREIADQVNVLISLQQEQTAAAVRNAETSYREVRNLMLLLGASTLFIGMVIALFVSRRVSRQAEQLAVQALYDPLTNLPNRCLLQDRLGQAVAQSQRNKRTFAVALMDLDRFKEINDTLGHEVGDELLREVGKRLRRAVRAEDTVARMGGDEFVIILQELAEADVAGFANKLHAALEPPFIWKNQGVDIGASVGIAFFPLHAEDPSSLIRYADIAMYAAKRSGLDYAVYAPEQERVGPSELSLKSELREAIQSNQLSLHYLPIIDHIKHRVVGVEALVRWNHPERGVLSPEKFIHLIEDVGLIGPLTQWVLKAALTELAALHAQGYPLTMGINLYARNLQDPELPATIASLLSTNNMASEYLALEITESAVMTKPSDGLVILSKLDRMGVTLSIDNFGTGYSSLSYLRQLPVDEIKIDKSFVMDMEKNENDAVIVRSTIELAHNLGLRVAAEGVETEYAWDRLTALGCDHSQGYYISKPLPVDSLIEWLKESPWADGFAVQPAGMKISKESAG